MREYETHDQFNSSQLHLWHGEAVHANIVSAGTVLPFELMISQGRCHMGKAKWILLLLTWPMGAASFYMIIVEGFKQDPYALAVHEMLFLLLVLVLMIFAFLFKKPVNPERWTALWHAVWFSFLAIPSVIIATLLFVLPSLMFVLQDVKLVFSFVAICLAGVVLYGTICAYREVVVK